MTVDILFVSFNRLAFVKASFEQLLVATDWDLVRTLYVMDDGSIDGTREWLYEEAAPLRTPAIVAAANKPFGGPVGAMNRYLDVRESARSDIMIKIDSDVIVPKDWLNVLLATARVNTAIDVLGFEPGFGDGLAPITRPDTPRTVKLGPHVGGVGLIRNRIFARYRPRPEKTYFGWTQHQRQHARCAWLAPDIPAFLLDHIDVEPWRSFATEYIDRGWSRAWVDYFDPPPSYYEWWLRERHGVTP